MVNFFKHNNLSQLFAIVLLVTVLWIPVFVSHVSEVVEGSPITPLYNLVKNIFGSSGLALTIFTFVVLGISMLFFNSMLSVNQLVTRNSSIGAFIFVLCMCCVPIKDEFYPFLLSTPLIMMLLQTVYLIYQVEKPEPYLMNSGIFIAIASMFYFPSIVLIVWVLMVMVIMDFRKLRHFLIPILGLVFPYFILFVVFYFNHSLIENINDYTLSFSELVLERLDISTFETIAVIMVAVFTCLSLVVIKSGNADNSVGTRKKVTATLWLLAFGFLMLFMQKPVIYNGLIFIVLAMFISMALCYVKKTKVINIIIGVFMLAIIVNQYLPLFGINL